MNWKTISQHISQCSGTNFIAKEAESLSGGCINQVFCLTDGNNLYCVKLNRADHHDLFKAEHAGLLELAAAEAIRVPRPICDGLSEGKSYLVLEYIKLSSDGNRGMAQAGQQLANMHHTTAEQFGWQADNFIGTTPQFNQQTESWCDFWRDQRLGYQLSLAKQNGYRGQLQHRGERLLELLPLLLNHMPEASLLHGDLWSGNIGFTVEGAPLIFDPAPYYGDREADLAMTELFGGFSSEFYAAYRESWPLDAEYGVRKQLYNLYHILNHLNLFGGGYLREAEVMIDRLLAELD